MIDPFPHERPKATPRNAGDGEVGCLLVIVVAACAGYIAWDHHEHSLEVTKCPPGTQCAGSTPSGSVSKPVPQAAQAGGNPWLQRYEPTKLEWLVNILQINARSECDENSCIAPQFSVAGKGLQVDVRSLPMPRERMQRLVSLNVLEWIWLGAKKIGLPAPPTTVVVWAYQPRGIKQNSATFTCNITSEEHQYGELYKQCTIVWDWTD